MRRRLGTAQYLSSEQARGDAVGPPADVFGIGATLWAAATARRPFGVPENGGPYEQAKRRAEPVAGHRRLPRPLSQLIDACLEPEPERRPAVREVLAACEALAGPR